MIQIAIYSIRMGSKQGQRLLAILLFIFTLSGIPSSVYGLVNTTLIGQLPFGTCEAVDAVGNTVYFGQGTAMKIMNFSDPTNPVELGSINFLQTVQKIKIQDSYAFVLINCQGIRVIDISQSANPIQIGSIDTEGCAGDFDVRGNYIYVTDLPSGLRIIDISDPSAPDEIGFCETNDATQAVFVSGTNAFIAVGSTGLQIIDISDHHNPVQSGSFDTMGYTRDVSVQDHYAYLADGSGGLQIVDVINPQNPTDVGIYEMGSQSRYIMIQDEVAYVCNSAADIQVLDISDPLNPSLRGSYATGGMVNEIVIADDITYVANDIQGLSIINFEIPDNPVVLGTYETYDIVSDVDLEGDIAYVGLVTGGLGVVDISNLENPTLMSQYEIEGRIYDVTVREDYVYLACGSAGLQIIDISDPQNLTTVGQHTTEGASIEVIARGNYAFLAAGADGLRIIDITDVTNPFEAGAYNIESYVYNVTLEDNHAYLSGWNFIRIIDISNPTAPFETTFYEADNTISDLAISENYVFAAAADDGMCIVDFLDPANPMDMGCWGHVSASSYAYALSIAVAGDLAYTAGSYGGLRIFDISDLNNITESGYFSMGGAEAGHFTLRDNLAFLTTYDQGLFIVHIDLQSAYLSVERSSGRKGESVSLGVNVIIPEGADISSTELSFEGFQGSLEFLGISQENSLAGAAGWDVYVNETDTSLVTACGGSSTISEEGTLLWVNFYIPHTLDLEFVPITISSALFDEGELTIDIINGGIIISESIVYGDANLSEIVDIDDALLILQHVVGGENLTPAGLLSANVNSDAVISAWDASLIIQYSMGLIDSLPVDDSDGSFQASGNIEMENMNAFQDSILLIPIQLTDAHNILSFEGEIHYNAELLNLENSITWCDATVEFELEINHEPGLIRFAAASDSPIEGTSVFALLHATISENFLHGNTTTLTVESMRFNSNIELPNITAIITSTVSVDGGIALPKTFSLQQNFPNPFNPDTMIKYGLPNRSNVSLVIYDARGRELITLIQGERSAGYHSARWDGRQRSGAKLSTGIYFARLQADEYSSVIKMVYLR